MAIRLNKVSSDLSSEIIPTKFLAIDEEGYFLLDGLRVAEQSTGLDWLSRIRMDERGRPFLSNEPETRILIEAFDQPLVALDVEISRRSDGTALIIARFPYGFSTELKADSFRSDEWDRFYARSREGVPVVISRAAQSRLFQLATEFDDDSVTFGDLTLPIQPLYQNLEEVSDSGWWSDLYKKGDTRWDDGEAHPLLPMIVPHMKIPRSRVLVLGCGAGHDAAWWAQRGHIVTGVDFSEEAIARAKTKYGEHDSLKWVQADVFNLPASWSSQFDYIFEHTMFCAISPERREELVKIWWRLLTPRGRIMGFVPVMDKLSGPPFGTSEWEMRRRLLDAPQHGSLSKRKPRFIPIIWNREKNSKEKRLGHELYFLIERADSLTD